MSELNPNPKEHELNGIIHKTIETIKATVKNMKDSPLVQEESDIGSKTLELEIER